MPTVTVDRPDGTARRPAGAGANVLVVGGGFGGLYAARALGRKPVHVTLVDRHNYHLFQPLLYQVATAALSPGDIAEPIRSILRRQRNVHVLLAEVTSVDLDRQCVRLTDGQALRYDYLILAPGSTHSYFGHDGWEEHAPGLKSLDDALGVRRRILLAFERAERETDPERRRGLLTFVVVGGGPTGVELAGAIAEIARRTVVGDFRSIDPSTARVILVESGPRILPPYPPDLSAKAERSLREIGVEVLTGRPVTGITPTSVQIGDEIIACHTTLWAAGVASSPLGRTLGVPLDRIGRVVVEPDLTVPGYPNAYVIGDLASFSHGGGKPLPGLAPVAIQQGETAAENIWRTAQGFPRKRFHYVDRGTMATIGRAHAVAQIGPIHLSGFLAWAAWLLVHLLWLIGFANRMLVLFQWAWSYTTFQRGARLITGRASGDRLLDG